MSELLFCFISTCKEYKRDLSYLTHISFFRSNKSVKRILFGRPG